MNPDVDKLPVSVSPHPPIILHGLKVTSENSELGTTKRRVEIPHSEIQHTSNQRRFFFCFGF